MSDRIQFRRDTAARWKEFNPILQDGELGLETDTKNSKLGDGIHHWNDLEYVIAIHNITNELGDSTNLVMSQKGTTDAINNLKEETEISLDEIAKEIWPLEVLFNINPKSEEYTNNNKVVVIDWNIKRKKKVISNDKITKLEIKQNNDIIYSQKKASGTLDVNVNSLTKMVFKIDVSADGLTNTTSINYQQYLPIYAGFSSQANVGDLSITSLTKFSKEDVKGEYRVTNNVKGNYFWLCVPNDKTINKVTLNGFNVPLNPYSQGSSPFGSYKCYRSANALDAKTFTFKAE